MFRFIIFSHIYYYCYKSEFFLLFNYFFSSLFFSINCIKILFIEIKLLTVILVASSSLIFNSFSLSIKNFVI